MYEFQNLPFNIKKNRTKLKLTQSELAEILFLTPQNISKWEKGKSIPDLTNLCKLANLFKISIEDLLGINTISERCKTMIAIDGGGTKTKFVLIKTTGEIIKKAEYSGSNPNSCGLQNSIQVLKQGIDELILEDTNVISIYAGVAGCGSTENRNKILSILKNNYPDINIELKSDIYNAINSVINCDEFISAICGTGSVIYAKTSSEMSKIGGWGYLFDSGGSGFDYGRDAIRAALAQEDGIGKKTIITNMLEKELNGSVLDKLSSLYENGKDYIASFSSIVFEAYEKGDEVAEEIIINNVNKLYFLIDCAIKKYNCGSKVVFSGGMVKQKEILLKFLPNDKSQNIEYIFNEIPQIFGASVAAFKNTFGNAAFNDDFTKEFLDSYKKIFGDI